MCRARIGRTGGGAGRGNRARGRVCAARPKDAKCRPDTLAFGFRPPPLPTSTHRVNSASHFFFHVNSSAMPPQKEAGSEREAACAAR